MRAQLIDTAEQVGKAGLGSAQEQISRQVTAQVEYVRRALAPLSVDQLSRELAWVLRSDSTDGAKLVATEIVREQAELRASREKRPVPNPAVAQRLLAQARRTLTDAQAGPDEVCPDPHVPEADSSERAAPAESVPPAKTDVPDEGGQTGIDDLIAAIQEEGEQTRKTLREEGEKTRETIEGAGRARGKVGLLLGLATLLISCASLYLQAQQPSPPPSRTPGESILKIQGPVAPPAAGPAAGGLRLGPPPRFRLIGDGVLAARPHYRRDSHTALEKKLGIAPMKALVGAFIDGARSRIVRVALAEGHKVQR